MTRVNRHVGDFALAREEVLDPSLLTQRIFSQCVVLSVAIDPYRDVCGFRAISDRWFREIDEGEIVPNYVFYVEDDGYVYACETGK